MSQCTPTPWSFTFSITPARQVHLSVKVNNNKAAAVYWILIFKKQIKEILLFTYWKIQRLCINCTLHKRAINLEMHALLFSLVTDNFDGWHLSVNTLNLCVHVTVPTTYCGAKQFREDTQQQASAFCSQWPVFPISLFVLFHCDHIITFWSHLTKLKLNFKLKNLFYPNQISHNRQASSGGEHVS